MGAPQPRGDRRVCAPPQGVPIRMELGPKDLAGESVVLVRRDTGAKAPVPWADVAEAVPRLLKTIHVGIWKRKSCSNCYRTVTFIMHHMPMVQCAMLWSPLDLEVLSTYSDCTFDSRTSVRMILDQPTSHAQAGCAGTYLR